MCTPCMLDVTIFPLAACLAVLPCPGPVVGLSGTQDGVRSPKTVDRPGQPTHHLQALLPPASTFHEACQPPAMLLTSTTNPHNNAFQNACSADTGWPS